MKVVTPEEVGVSSQRLARLNSFMRRYVDENKLTGIVTLLARGGDVFHFERLGMADIEAKTPMDLGFTVSNLFYDQAHRERRLDDAL